MSCENGLASSSVLLISSVFTLPLTIIDYSILFPEAGHPRPETFQGSFIIILSVLVDIECFFLFRMDFTGQAICLQLLTALPERAPRLKKWPILSTNHFRRPAPTSYRRCRSPDWTTKDMLKSYLT